jgi:threonine dehydrogenase-like Zn-dependent dehydrogenase
LHPEQVFTHKLPLSQAADGYRIFDNREDGVLKVLLDPSS